MRSLSSRSNSISLSEAFLSGSSDSISVGDRLKNAISDALANADKPSKTIANREVIITLRSIGLTVI